MADLMRAGEMPAASEQQSLPSPVRPTGAPTPTRSPIRGPRVIMQERVAREARRAEAEQQQQMQQMERNRAEQESRRLEEARQRNAERQSGGMTAGVAARQGNGNGNGNAMHYQTESRRQPQGGIQEEQRDSRPSAASQGMAGQQRPEPISTSQQRQQRPTHQYSTSAPREPTQATTMPTTPQAAPAAEPTAQTAGNTQKPRNTFPHAFERWETLSAHWEGLTSYWLRKLEQNKDEINRDPLSQQLSRQVTDLSAAGANLFHAVVELQRLRASSERKFQRWFFETRADLERSREVNALLETALEKERQNQADAVQSAVEREQNSKAQQQLAEMRKELAISKEEARRAWEELGRREQEERDRTLSLQSGEPTIVGGVQVVPMVQASRQAAAAAQGPYQGEYSQGYPTEQRHTPTVQQVPTTTAAGSGGYYHVADPAQPQAASYEHGSEGAYSEEEYDTPVTTNPPSGGRYETPATSAAASQWSGTYSESQDYSGEGYAAPGWETMPRHHHPTRLSDVIEEEDERSRTSASQLGRG